MSSIALDLIIILLLLIANGVFAMSEMAVVSSRRARLKQRAEDGDRRAAAALELAEAPNRFLSTVQIGITMVGILAGAFGGATLAEKLAAIISRWPVLAPYSEAMGVALVVLLITYLSLVIGELVPKRLALNNAEGVASAVAIPMRGLSRLASPAVSILAVSTDLLLRVIGARPSGEPAVTEEEVRIMIAEGARTGVFPQSEAEMVHGVFRMGDRRVGELMTPRPRVVWLDVNAPVRESFRRMAECGHTMYPVGDGGLDDVVGVASLKTLWPLSEDGWPEDLSTVLDDPTFVLENMPVTQALDVFRTARRTLAIVLDEYGGVQGVLTLTDVLEAIVGDLPGEQEMVIPEVVRREDGSWLLAGVMLLDEIKDVLDIRSLPGEDDGDYQTLGGFVMHMLQRVPVEGDLFNAAGYRWEVVDMDGHRVDKVLAIARTPGDENADEETRGDLS